MQTFQQIIFIIGFALIAIGATLLSIGLASYRFNPMLKTISQHSKFPIRGKGIRIGSLLLLLGLPVLLFTVAMNG